MAGRFAALRDALLSALLWAGVPALIVGVYLYIFAADQYQAEAQFVVRGDTISVGADAGGTLGGIIELNTSQDTRIAADFIASGAVLPDLKQKIDLTNVFTARGLDVFAGLRPGSSAEQLGDYWRGIAAAEVDAVSGIVTVRVAAFSAEHASSLVAMAIAATETKLNALHRLTLEGAARVAAERASAATARLKDTRTEIKAFRDRYRAIDLKAGTSSTFELLSNLRRQRIEDRAELAVLRAQGAGGSPMIKGLEARISAADEQILALEKELTGNLNGDEGAATAAIELYDRLVLRQDLASQYVARTEAALGRADRRLDRRSIYLEVFSPPATPEDAVFPHRAQITLIVFLIVLSGWALARLAWAGIKSHEV